MTGLLFFFLERRDSYVRFHAAQATAAFGLIAGLILAFGLLAAASLSFLPRAFVPFIWAAGVTWSIGVLLWIVSMWKAATGGAWRIPVAAGLADRLIDRQTRGAGPA
jgi:uncharacterized membrane protein